MKNETPKWLSRQLDIVEKTVDTWSPAKQEWAGREQPIKTSQDVLDEVAALRKILEDKNWKMSDKGFKELEDKHKVILKDKHTKPGQVYYRDTLILNGFTRVVCGAHGHYIEFEDKNLLVHLEITKDQEWRNTDQYSYVKYLWLNPIDFPELKIYKQKHTVKYADYKPGYYYVDFWKVEINGTHN